VQIFIREQGLTQPIAATRLSDGTLHYLFLMALIQVHRHCCALKNHSDALISTLPPESVLVCERDNEGSHLRRLEADPLKDWLENYTIGDLWRMGHIGGKPW